MKRLIEKLKRAFEDIAFIDFRSLALFRICFGMVAFLDFYARAIETVPFYSDLGVLSRALTLGIQPWWTFSFHHINGTYGFNLGLHIIGMLISLSLMLGYRTRLASVLLWAFLVSAQNRNPLILHGGDVLFRVTAFFSIFLPLEARWSLDRLAHPPSQEERKVQGFANLASLVILLQVLYMYIFTAILKSDVDWRKDYDAVYWALNLGIFTKPLGAWIAKHMVLVKAITIGTLYLELIAPILLLIPFVQRKFARWVLPFLFIGLHFGLFLTMYLSLFAWLCMVVWLLFLPSGLWDFAARWKTWVPDVSVFFGWVLRALPEVREPKPSRWMPFVRHALLALYLPVITVYNIFMIPGVGDVPQPLEIVAGVIRIDQYWGMFAPRPTREDGWFVVDGRLKDGSPYDVWNNSSQVSFERPEDFDENYRGSGMWRKYFYNVWIDEQPENLQLEFGKYLCRQWNDSGEGSRRPERQLATYDLYYMRELTPMPGEKAIIEKKFVWGHDCFLPDKETGNETPQILSDKEGTAGSTGG